MRRSGIAAVSVLAGVALTACGGSTSGSAGGESIELRVGAYLPDTHPAAISGDQYFMEQAKKISDGRIKFDYYPAQQLGKAADLLDLTKSGTADIGMIAPSYMPDQLPISAVGELPSMFDTSCEGTAAFQELTRPEGYLYEAEFKPAGIRPLFGVMTAPYEIFTVSKPLDDLSAVRGLKLKTAGGAADTTARLMDSVPVQITSADIYTALERGTVDGRYGVYEYMPAVNSEKLLQNGTVGANVAAFAMTASISEQKWQTLDKDIQDALLEAGNRTAAHFCAEADKNNEKVRDQMVENNGWTLYELNDQEQAKLKKLVEPVYGEWAKKVSKNSKDSSASDALDAFRDAVPNDS